MATAKKKTARKPQTLAPVTQPADPEARQNRGMVLLPQRTAVPLVNEDTGMTQSAVWACIRVISESLAGMPWLVGNLMDDGTIDRIPNHPLHWLLNFMPNKETEAFTFRETLWAWALGWGNGYAEIERNMRKEPVALWQLHPSRVRLFRDPGDDALWYEVSNDMGGPSYVPYADMYHLRGPSPDALVGWSVIRMHARTIGLAIAQEDNAVSFNANDSTPGGLLKTPNRLSEQARSNLEKSWAARHQGPSKRRTVAILEENLDWVQTSIDPNDARLVEQMQLTPSLICRIFRVPPHKIADLTRSTNNNIEHQDLEFVKDTLRPWAERGEGEADLKLFGRNNQANLVTFIDMSERERGDTSAQTQHVKEMLFSGVYSVDEARLYLGLKPLPPGEGGDKRFVQSAMVLLKDVGTVPPGTPPQPAPQDPVPDTNEDDTEIDTEDTLAAITDKALIVVADAFRRIGKREGDSAKLSGDALEKWRTKHKSYCYDTLAPAAQVLGACVNAPQQRVELALRTFVDILQTGEAPIEADERASRFKTCLMAAIA